MYTDVLVENEGENAYRIVPNRHAVREWEGLGARLFLKWVECGYPLYQLLIRVDN